MRRSRQRTASRWRLFVNTPGRLVSCVIVVVFTLMAIAGPYLYPANLPIDPDDIYAPPTLAHPLGTDFEGTDTLALIVTGAPVRAAGGADRRGDHGRPRHRGRDWPPGTTRGSRAARSCR